MPSEHGPTLILLCCGGYEPCVRDANPVGEDIQSEWAPRVLPAQKRPTKTVTPQKEACWHEWLVLQLPNWMVLRKPGPPVAWVQSWRDAGRGCTRGYAL